MRGERHADSDPSLRRGRGSVLVVRCTSQWRTEATPATLRPMASGDKAISTEPVFAFAGGGTGGHIYPALAIAESLRDRVPDCRFLFFCTDRRVDERILGRSEFEVVRQPLRHISKSPWRWPAIIKGWRSARHLCRDRIAARSPVFVLGTGGLASVPAILEANREGIPTAILNPDAKPGKANRFLAGRVRVVFAQWEATRTFLKPCELAIVGCPIRPAFRGATREAGVAAFKLAPNKKTLLVTGASQGARSINDALIAIVEKLAAQKDWQLLHLTGDADLARVKNAYAEKKISATVLAFTDRMADALAAADLVVSRAGASTLAEITALGRPSILLPYPYHRDQHQLENARCLTRASAAQILLDEISPEKNGPALWGSLRSLMVDGDLRDRMGAAAKELGRIDAGAAIADRILQLSQVVALHETV
jgi:UDP-N-acetylglucosamine--N-acetylmuramyl-(pentapeptide) pyrophosphoryl-undecaprenol N-acetylglucosamine transferase